MAANSDVQRVVSDEGVGTRTMVAEHSKSSGPISRTKEISVAVAVGVLGMALMLFGVVMVLARVKLATLLFGARASIGTPLTDLDTARVLFVAVSGIAIAAIGLITVVGGSVVTVLAALRSRE